VTGRPTSLGLQILSVGSSDVTFRLADIQRRILGNTSLQLKRLSNPIAQVPGASWAGHTAREHLDVEANLLG